MVERIRVFKEELVTVRELMRGTILRHRSVSKAGKSSACIFVPSYFLGQKVKLIVIPEDEEAVAIRKALDDRIKRNGKIMKEKKELQEVIKILKEKLESKELEKVEEAGEEVEEVKEVPDKELEGEDEY